MGLNFQLASISFPALLSPIRSHMHPMSTALRNQASMRYVRTSLGAANTKFPKLGQIPGSIRPDTNALPWTPPSQLKCHRNTTRIEESAASELHRSRYRDFH